MKVLEFDGRVYRKSLNFSSL